MKKISIQLTLEELSTLNDALRYTHPFPAGRRRRVYEKLRQDIRTELAVAVEEDRSDGE